MIDSPLFSIIVVMVKKKNNWFTRATLASAMNDPYSGAVMQASGFMRDPETGDIVQGDFNEEGATSLRRSLAEIASVPMFDLGIGFAGEAAMTIPKVRRAVAAYEAAKELNRAVKGAPGWFVTESGSRSGAPLLREAQEVLPFSSSDYSMTRTSPAYSGRIAVSESPAARAFVEDVDEAVGWASRRGPYKPEGAGYIELYPSDYIGDGAEMYVYKNRNNPNEVYKQLHALLDDSFEPGSIPNFESQDEALEFGRKWLKNENTRLYNLRLTLEGVSDNGVGGYSPVFSQPKATIAKNNTIAAPDSKLRELAQRIGDRTSEFSAYGERAFPKNAATTNYVQPKGTLRTNSIIYENGFNMVNQTPFGRPYLISKDFSRRNVGVIGPDRKLMGVDLKKYGGLISRLQKHYGSNDKVLEVVRKMRAGGPEGEGDVDFVGPPVPYSLVTAGDIPMPEYDIFNDASSYNRRDAHLKSLDAFIAANPTVSGLNTADFRDVLSQFAGLESSYKKDASNKSGYSGYYGLKGGSALAEDAQHRKAYEHLASLFKHSITRDDIQKGIDMGYTPAQILYKYWNQGNNATEFLQNGSAATIGNNPGLDIMGNNISAIADYYKYIPDAVMDDFHVVKSGDNFSTIQERVRKPGRHYNQAGKDLKQWNTDDIVNGKLRIGDKVWFTTPYEDGGNLFKAGGPEKAALIDRINSTSKADFVKRLQDPNRMSMNYGDSVATHRMAYATDDDGNAIVYPEVQSAGDTLQWFHGWDALDRAINSGDTLMMSVPDAEWFTMNYKKYYPGFEDGGLLKDYRSGGKIHIKPEIFNGKVYYRNGGILEGDFDVDDISDDELYELERLGYDVEVL